MKKIILTELGEKKLKNELKELKKKILNIKEEIHKAKNLGDLSDNSEYRSAKNYNYINEKRILELEKIFSNYEIINSSKINNKNLIGFSAEIQLENLKNKNILIYKIVGDEEINITPNALSYKSPIAQNLIGKKLNDIIVLKKFNKINKLKIISIKYN